MGGSASATAQCRAKVRGEEGAERKDKGPTGKQFFQRLEADGREVGMGWHMHPLACMHARLASMCKDDVGSVGAATTYPVMLQYRQ